MDIKKLIPWNWFKKEEEENATTVPVRYSGGQEVASYSPMAQLHQEIDRLFSSALRDFGLSPSIFGTGFERLLPPAGGSSALLKPSVDIGATDTEYTISIEVPGVDVKDVELEIAGNALTVRGEKRQEKEDQDKNFYRVERSYGMFQRVLSLPEDADRENIKATSKNGVLTIRMPRRPQPREDVKRIEISDGE
jgi:HSP20 family protein